MQVALVHYLTRRRGAVRARAVHRDDPQQRGGNPPRGRAHPQRGRAQLRRVRPFRRRRRSGQVFTVFIIVLAASEAAIALAIVLQVYRGYRSILADQLTDLRN